MTTIFKLILINDLIRSLSQILCVIQMRQKLVIFDMITFALTKINEIESLACNCFTCHQVLIRKKRRQYKQFLIEHFDENILKSIRKYCKSNKSHRENVVRARSFLIKHFDEKYFKTYVDQKKYCKSRNMNRCKDISSDIFLYVMQQ